MFLPPVITTAEERIRLLRGSVEEQTAQWQPMTGTPVDVPQPNIRSFIG